MLYPTLKQHQDQSNGPLQLATPFYNIITIRFNHSMPVVLLLHCMQPLVLLIITSGLAHMNLLEKIFAINRSSIYRI